MTAAQTAKTSSMFFAHDLCVSADCALPCDEAKRQLPRREAAVQLQQGSPQRLEAAVGAVDGAGDSPEKGVLACSNGWELHTENERGSTFYEDSVLRSNLSSR